MCSLGQYAVMYHIYASVTPIGFYVRIVQFVYSLHQHNHVDYCVLYILCIDWLLRTVHAVCIDGLLRTVPVSMQRHQS